MSFFNLQTARVDIDEENYVELRQPTIADRQKIMEPIAHLMSENEMLFGMSAQMSAVTTLLKEWYGPGFAGFECIPDNIKNLPPEIFDIIAKEAVALISETPEAEKK
jgi:hypothetical protein